MGITRVNVTTPTNEIIFADSAMGNAVDAVKASSAVVNYVIVDNTLNGSPVYVKLYNLASGSVTVGTSAPDEIIFVPANVIVTHVLYTGAVSGKTFSTALSAICVTSGGTAGSTSPVSNVPVTISYI
jgi:hypothetical protein